MNTTSFKSGAGLIRRTPTASQGARGLMNRSINVLLLWNERARQRQHLSRLDDRLIKDMGITHADVEAEIRKPFWKS